MKLYNGKRKKPTNFKSVKPIKYQVEKEYTDEDFVAVYAKESTEYIGEFNYGQRERGERFFIYKNDKFDNVSKRPIKRLETVTIENEEIVETENTNVVNETTDQETI